MGPNTLDVHTVSTTHPSNDAPDRLLLSRYQVFEIFSKLYVWL